MEYIEKWKTKFTIEERKKESRKLLDRFERVPVMVDRLDKHGPVINNHKFLVPYDITIGQFLSIIRKRIELHPSEAIFLFYENGTLVQTTQYISQCYKKHQNEDQFLYLFYGLENTFGSF